MGPQLRPIAELNQLALNAFADALRPLLEAAGPLAGALHAERPFTSYADLIDRAEAVSARLTTAQQIEVLSAHPRIGAPADAVRQASALSYREQGFEAESSLPSDEVQRAYKALAQLNTAYEQRFGFRFVVFVNGRPKSQIVKLLHGRLANSREVELSAGLSAMFSIARDRVSALSADGCPAG